MWELNLKDIDYFLNNDGHRYLLHAIDPFSKYTHMVTIRSKTGEDIASAISSILARRRGKRSHGVRTDKYKEFVKARFSKLLTGVDPDMRVLRNLDMKCAIVEGFRMLK
jgi:hypothetical protein